MEMKVDHMHPDLRITIESAPEGGYHVVSEGGAELVIDVPTHVGGRAEAWQPTQLLLAALGGCVAIDMVNVLRKQRQDVEDYRIVVTGRRSDEPGGPFAELEAQHDAPAGVPAAVLAQAVRLVDERLCTIGLTLRRSTVVRHVLTGDSAVEEIGPS